MRCTVMGSSFPRSIGHTTAARAVHIIFAAWRQRARCTGEGCECASMSDITTRCARHFLLSLSRLGGRERRNYGVVSYRIRASYIWATVLLDFLVHGEYSLGFTFTESMPFFVEAWKSVVDKEASASAAKARTQSLKIEIRVSCHLSLGGWAIELSTSFA